jgi:N-acetylglutamate synthase-like GNAT family acetyltransferase
MLLRAEEMTEEEMTEEEMTEEDSELALGCAGLEAFRSSRIRGGIGGVGNNS